MTQPGQAPPCAKCGQHRDANVHLKQYGYPHYHKYIEELHVSTWFKVNKISDRIEPVEVSKVTDKCLFLAEGRRAYKSGEWENYFETEIEAFQHVVDRLDLTVRVLEKQLDSARKRLAWARNARTDRLAAINKSALDNYPEIHKAGVGHKSDT